MRSVLLTCSLLAVLMPALPAQTAAPQDSRRPDVHFVPTPPEVVSAMLKLAEVTKNDVLYDLGSGDGRIPITAARMYGTRGVGIDLDPVRIGESNANAQKEGVTDRVRFIQGDLFEQNISDATVVTLYLLPSLNVKLIPKLNKELKPGTRVVSQSFDMGGIKPVAQVDVNGRPVYMWVVPIK